MPAARPHLRQGRQAAGVRDGARRRGARPRAPWPGSRTSSSPSPRPPSRTPQLREALTDRGAARSTTGRRSCATSSGTRANPVTINLISFVIESGRARDLSKIADGVRRRSPPRRREHAVAEVRIGRSADRQAARAAREGAVQGDGPRRRGQGRRGSDRGRRRDRARRRSRLRRLGLEPPRGRQTSTRELTNHMASNLIDPAVIADALRKNVEGWTPSVEREEVGRVIETGDGIARVSGLPRTMANELLEFPGGLLGVGLQPGRGRDRLHHLRRGRRASRRATRSSRPDASCRCRSATRSSAGSSTASAARSTRRARSPPRPSARSSCRRPTSSRAKPVKEPLYTGITAIDAMTAIGRGQRQLIIGDRQTGKTAVALDTIINQKQYWGTDEAVRCIYVADRPEGLDGRRGRRDPSRERRARVHGGGERRGLRPRAVPVRRAVLGRGDRRALDGRTASTC